MTSRGAVDTDRGVFFIGQENFFLFNGNTVQTINAMCMIISLVTLILLSKLKYGQWAYRNMVKCGGLPIS